LAKEKKFARVNRRLRHFVMKENCDIGRRFVGGKNARCVVDAIGVGEGFLVGKNREAKRANNGIKILRLGQGQPA
jgi:hypothetical protein